MVASTRPSTTLIALPDIQYLPGISDVAWNMRSKAYCCLVLVLVSSTVVGAHISLAARKSFLKSHNQRLELILLRQALFLLRNIDQAAEVCFVVVPPRFGHPFQQSKLFLDGMSHCQK